MAKCLRPQQQQQQQQQQLQQQQQQPQAIMASPTNGKADNNLGQGQDFQKAGSSSSSNNLISVPLLGRLPTSSSSSCPTQVLLPKRSSQSSADAEINLQQLQQLGFIEAVPFEVPFSNAAAATGGGQQQQQQQLQQLLDNSVLNQVTINARPAINGNLVSGVGSRCGAAAALNGLGDMSVDMQWSNEEPNLSDVILETDLFLVRTFENCEMHSTCFAQKGLIGPALSAGAKLF